MSLIISWIVTMVAVIIMIPFLTLLERKILSYIQFRKGPKKVRIIGILQPITDGVKLVMKEAGRKLRTKKKIFWFSPLLNFFFMLLLYLIFSPFFPAFSLEFGVIGYVCVSSLLVYTILGSGWRRKSKFSFLGRLRGAAQIISYEISLFVLIFFPCLLKKSYKIKEINLGFIFIRFMVIILFINWMISIVAETKRSPFDFAEGERELVSGFKTEYGGLIFALLFLGEYGKIIFIRLFTTFFFFPNLYVIQLLIGLLIIKMFLVFRGTFPRFRYDFLMILAWKVILPLSLIWLWMVFFFLKKGV